jgi:hypothetical protein
MPLLLVFEGILKNASKDLLRLAFPNHSEMPGKAFEGFFATFEGV